VLALPQEVIRKTPSELAFPVKNGLFLAIATV
jgi:hypothetical protein